VNIFGALQRSKVTEVFKKIGEKKQKKVTEKREFLSKTSFRKNPFFIYL